MKLYRSDGNGDGGRAQPRHVCKLYADQLRGENECLACARDPRPANSPRPIQQHLTAGAVSSGVAYWYSLPYRYYYYVCV